MLQLGNDPLSHEEAKEYLDNPGDIWTECKVKPKGGEGYFYRAKGSTWKVDFKSDQYNFVYTGCGTSYAHDMKKRYYAIKDPALGGRNTLDGFRRFVYSRTSDEEDVKSAPLYLIHYVGDSSLHQDTRHGNAKHKTGIYFQTSEKAMGKMREKLDKSAKSVYNDIQTEMSKAEDQTRMPTDRPRDRKQCENLKYSAKKSGEISRDEIFSSLELAGQLTGFVRKLEIYPNLVVILAHEDLYQETIDIIKLSKKNENLPQHLAYDTTFKMGDFYLSTLVCRNTKLVNDGIFPVGFLIHERKFMSHHETFLRNVLGGLGIGRSPNFPIVTDREIGITKPLKKCFSQISNLFCANHVLRDIEAWLRQNGGSADDRKVLKDDILKLIESKSIEDFERIYGVLSTTWSEKFREYVEKNIKKDIVEHTCYFVTKKFAAFRDGYATNNSSESMNAVLKRVTGNKELPLDAIIFALYQMQSVYMYEFQRALSGYGNYSLKSEFLHLGKHHSEIYTPPIVDMDDIVTAVDKLPRGKTVEKGATYRLTQSNMARMCVRQGLIGFSSTTGSFSVLSLDGKRVNSVRYLPKPSVCSCPSTGRCYHIMALEMSLRDRSSKDKASYSLSTLRKRHRGKERKSGRKAPRLRDFDYDVQPAPDAFDPKDRAKLILQSTPKKSDSMPVDLNVSLVVGEQEDDGNLSEILDITADSCVPESLHAEKFESYPWLATDLQSQDGPSIECLEEGAWLVDDVIEKPIKKFCIENKNSTSVLFLERFLYDCTVNNYTQPISTFACNNQAANKDLLILLVNPGAHWLLAVVNMNVKLIAIIDSMLGHDDTYRKIFQNVFKITKACFSVADIDVEISEWAFAVCRDVPQQVNKFDCGVHVVVNAFCIVNEFPLPSTVASATCRSWIKNLNASNVVDNITIASRQERNVALRRVDARWLEGEYTVQFVSQDFEKCFCFSTLNKSKWSKCDTTKCAGNQTGEEQVLCAACRKWFHLTCLPGNVTSVAGTYFVCMQSTDAKEN